MVKRKQGDALWANVKAKNINLIDTTWANWTASWSIVTTLGSIPLLSGSLIRDETTFGLFGLRIGATVMASLTIREYILIIQVENADVDYIQEIAQERLSITTQGKA